MADSPPDDRELLTNCLNRQYGAWNDFVDRYLGLIYRVIHFTAYNRSVKLSPEDVEDVASEVLVQIIANDYAVLRQFQGRSSFTTYLTVIVRRICVHAMMRRMNKPATVPLDPHQPAKATPQHVPDASAETQDEIHHLLAKLPPKTREAVRLFFLEGRTYEEISTQLGIPVNSIGPLLARAKAYLKKRTAKSAVVRK